MEKWYERKIGKHEARPVSQTRPHWREHIKKLKEELAKLRTKMQKTWAHSESREPGALPVHGVAKSDTIE